MSSKKLFQIVVGIVILAVLALTARHNYLFFHSLTEIFAIVIACGIFMIAWNSREYFEHDRLLLIGIAYLFVGGLDLIHTLAFKGMGIIGDTGSNAATQLWVAARLLESVSLVVALLMPRRRIVGEIGVAVYGVVTGLLLASIFWWNVFPICYLEGSGLTRFKVAAEYVVVAILAAAIVVLARRRREFDSAVFGWVAASLGLTIASELFFTVYVDVYGLANGLGHLFKVVSFYCMYRAIIQTGLQTPFKLLFRELKEAEALYRSLFTHMTDGFAYHEIVKDDAGKAVDYVFLEVNDAFERLTRLRREDLIGRRVTEAIPAISEDSADWIGTYGKVALEGRSARFETYSELLGRWYVVSAYSPREGFFATVFQDATRRKQMEAALRERLHETAVQLEARKTDLRRLVSELSLAEHRERGRLAQVLHDHLQQLLVAAMMQLSILGADIADDEPRKSICRVVDLLKETLEETRHLTSDLSPPVLKEEGLAAGLAWLSTWMLDKHALDVEVDCGDAADGLGEDMRILLFQSVRELLFNVVKHAGTHRAWVRAEREGGMLCVMVRDEGAGFDAARLWDAASQTQGGFGLRTIRERLQMAGGRLEADSAAGGGAMFTLVIPAAATQPAADSGRCETEQ
ncbi:MAG: PAS domain S-box protein [Phycisphaerae bacterium]|nr:PAS domain S-box protein [Phycisphaerae bacterium]